MTTFSASCVRVKPPSGEQSCIIGAEVGEAGGIAVDVEFGVGVKVGEWIGTAEEIGSYGVNDGVGREVAELPVVQAVKRADKHNRIALDLVENNREISMQKGKLNS